MLSFAVCSIREYYVLQSSELVLGTVHQLLVTTMNQLDSEPFMNIEVSLRFFYMMGEVLPDKVVYCCYSQLVIVVATLLGLPFFWSSIIQLTMVPYDEYCKWCILQCDWLELVQMYIEMGGGGFQVVLKIVFCFLPNEYQLINLV